MSTKHPVVYTATSIDVEMALHPFNDDCESGEHGFRVVLHVEDDRWMSSTIGVDAWNGDPDLDGAHVFENSGEALAWLLEGESR